MPIVTNSKSLPLYKRKLKCPNHYMLIPGRTGFLKEPNALGKKYTEKQLKEFKLKNWQFKKDRYGQKIIDWRDYYQPEVTAAFAIEHIYDPRNHTCKNQCRGTCLEGHGAQAWQSVKRLSDGA